jgi:thioesterase domain-containing protein
MMTIRALRASVAYRPLPYTGELMLFQASRPDLAVPSMTARWGKYATTVHQRKLPGRHMEFLTGAAAVSAAQLLTQCLEGAMRTTSRSESSQPG